MDWTSLVLFAVWCILWHPVTALDKSQCKCRVPAQKRIIGGNEIGELYPWHVTIRSNDNSSQKTPDEKQQLGDDYKLERHISSGIGKGFDKPGLFILRNFSFTLLAIKNGFKDFSA